MSQLQRKNRFAPKTFPATIHLYLALVAIAALGVAGCGSSSSSKGYAGLKRPVSATPPSSGCGSYSLPAVKDPDGVVASLPAANKEQYAGYFTPVRRSAWANWKPKHGPPYTVGIQWGAVNNSFQSQLTSQIRARLAADKSVGKVIFKSTGDNIDVGQQISQLSALILRKPDIIIVELIQADAMKPLIERAGRAGIPTLVVVDQSDSRYAVAVQFNQYAAAVRGAAQTVRQAGGKGNLMIVHGIPGTATEVQAAEAFDAVLERCPDVKKVGDVYANFEVALAKSDTLRFLGTHPAPVNAVLDSGAMAPGVMSGFQQSGRAMPVVLDAGPVKGSIGYWSKNKGSYYGAATGIAVQSFGNTIADVGSRMLAGQGIKLTDVVGESSLITDANLSEWADSSWSLSDSAFAPGPKTGFADKKYLDPLFNNPE